VVEHQTLQEFYLNYDFNYICKKKFRLLCCKGDDKIAKTDDRLELNSLWGKRLKATGTIPCFFFKTQMDAGLDKG
jgi:hypothetical protein